MPEFIRVTDEVKPRREYTIVASTLDEKVHTVLESAATSPDGTPLPPKYTPESLSRNRGQSAESTKEK